MGRDSHNTVARLTLAVALFLAILLLPWYVAAVLTLWGVYHYERYAEILFAAVFFDALYGGEAYTFSGHTAFFVALMIFVAAIPLRKYLLFSR